MCYSESIFASYHQKLQLFLTQPSVLCPSWPWSGQDKWRPRPPTPLPDRSSAHHSVDVLTRSLRGGGEAGTCFWNCREMMGAAEGARKDVTWQITNQACFGTADKNLDKESVGLLPAQVQALPKVHVVMKVCQIPRMQNNPQNPPKKGQSFQNSPGWSSLSSAF